MRADAIRYFILATYGGIYLDLDDVCTPLGSNGIVLTFPQGLPTETRSPSHLPRVAQEDCADRNFKRRHGQRAAASLLPPCHPESAEL